MNYNNFMCHDININVKPNGVSERESLLTEEIVKESLWYLKYNGLQTARLYLGNKFDTNYIDKTVPALYLGTMIGRHNMTHMWLYYSHDGRLCVCKTLNSDDLRDDYDHASRTTEARCIKHWSKEVQEKAEEVLAYAGIYRYNKIAA